MSLILVSISYKRLFICFSKLSYDFNKVSSIIVIDDLCDGGGTFALTAGKLKELYPDAKLTIVVGHMVNPKGIETLHDNYDQVYFTNTYKDWKVDYENVEIINFVS